MMPSETMTWAGPLPPGESEGTGIETMTFAGPLASVATERSGVEEEAGGPIMWAGPLPPWMDRGGKALTGGSSFSARAFRI